MTTFDADHTDTFRTGEVVPFTRTGSEKLAELIDGLRQSELTHIAAADIGSAIASAARENTMTTERPTNVTEVLASQMTDYAAKVQAAIDGIETEQKVADDAHSDAILALKNEIAEREKVHTDLTALNEARIADHRRALAGIEALQTTINPANFKPAEAPKPTNVAKISGGGKGRAIAPGAVELED